jgi:hypothetical protein
MSKPMIRLHDIETGDVIDREMTDAEYAIYQGQTSDMSGVQYE